MEKKPPALLQNPGVIQIRGARQNNLKNIDLDVPLGRLNVISGPSGSGKSSLAFDTIYAEGQRRYVETFSPYTRQFLERMDKPLVDEIRGIPPAIAIEQSNHVKSTRSTVGTMTEINDYLKLLLPRIVQAFCPSCSREIRPETAKSITEEILRHLDRSESASEVERSRGAFDDDHFTETPRDLSTTLRSGRDDNAAALASFPQSAIRNPQSLLVTFGVPVPPKTKPADFFDFLKQQGYLRVWLNGVVRRTDDPDGIARLPGLVRVIQDRITIHADNAARLHEAVEVALRFGRGQVTFIRESDGHEFPFSTGWHCAHCDLEITAPSPGLFSFNNPLGACPKCRGFGRTIAIDLNRAIPDRTLSIAAGAIKPFQSENGRDCQRDLLRCAAERELDVRAPFEELIKADQDWVMHGERSPGISGEELWQNGRWYGVKGFFDWLETKSYKMHVRVLLSRYRDYTICPDCQGGRFQPATLNFRFAEKTLPELLALPVDKLAHLFRHPERSEAERNGVEGARGVSVQREFPDAPRDSSTSLSSARNDSTTELLATQVRSRLGFLVEVGLGYLSLDRATRTLSGGEVERVNLTTCLGASLVNTLFVLDEPSIGLHPRDIGRLIRVMKGLRDKGNTLLVVEHEEAIIRTADNLIEIGPGRGDGGGELVFNGPLDEIRDTLTADYLSGRKSIPVPEKRRTPRGWIRVEGATAHNLQKIDVDFPLGVFGCVTGVSGSGKSTLVHEVLYENLAREKDGSDGGEIAGTCRRIIGANKIDRVVMVDQSPLARTPRSCPALYLGVFDHIREAFAMLPESLAEGLSASAFSFNAGSGRCERCCGNGFEKVEMQFLSDLYVRCPECDGKRYQPHILKIRLAGKSIHDVLEMTVSESMGFFDELGLKRITGPLGQLESVGLGYLRLGQPLNVLSGGESQRLKLVSHLTKESVTNSLLIFDEPTTGLHFDDVALLLKVFQQLVEQGNSLLVIEHNLEVIKSADYVIDLGPEAGAAGGLVVAKGTPEEVAACEESHTGKAIADCGKGVNGERSSRC